MVYLISSCLLGEVCRWHGRKSAVPSEIKRIISNIGKTGDRIISVCPEMLGGLPVPRPPVKTRNGRIFETCPDKSQRNNVTGKELTAEFISGAQKTLEIAIREKPDKCLLCKFSPSCDKNGITGKLLVQNGFDVVNLF